MKEKILILLLFSIGSISLAQNSDVKKQISNGFEYVEFVKEKDNENLPLLILFHHSGGNPNRTILDYNYLKYPVRIIIPKGNFEKRDGFSYYPVNYYQQDSLNQYTTSKKIVDSIANFVKTMTKIYKRKAIVSGISQGGDIAFLLAIYYPELLMASLPFAATMNHYNINDITEKTIEKIPIYIYQGEIDEIVQLEKTKKNIIKIGNILNIHLASYPGLGHDISKQMKKDYSKVIDSINSSRFP